MKLTYDPDTDSLYIELVGGSAHSSTELTEGVVVDYAADRTVIGFDIEHASRKFDVSTLETDGLPLQRLKAA